MKKNYFQLRTKITLLIFLSLAFGKSRAQTGVLTGWGMSVCNQYSFSICPGVVITPFNYGSQTYVCNMTVMPDVSFVNQGPVWRVAKHNWNFVATGANALITGVDPSGNTISWPFMAGAVLAPSAYTNSNSVNYVTFSINNSPITFTVNQSNFQIQLSGTTTPISANSATICQGQAATLTASGAGNYTWSPGNSNGASFVANPSTSTIYTVSGNNGNCSFIATKIVTVTVNNSPTLAISGNTFICKGNTVTLTASGASTYSWSSGAAVPSVTLAPLLTTTYSVMGSIANGCSSNALVTVTVNNNPTLAISGSTFVCSGNTVTLTASGATTYSWSSGAAVSSVTLAPLLTTTYSVMGSFANGCSSNTIVTVTVNNSPTLAISGNTFICRGNTVTLTASGASTYSWSSGAAVPGVTLAPLLTTTYSVKGTLANGCSSKAVVTVSVSACTGVNELLSPHQMSIYPNPFTEFISIQCSENCALVISDINGKIVYRAENLNQGLSKHNLSHLADGIYMAKLISDNQQQSFKLIKHN